MEPMYVLTYITDQRIAWSAALQHLMHGTTLRDDSFINVIYQRNLDVLDVPFRIRPNVTIPVGAYNMTSGSFTYNTSPGRRLYERVTYAPERVLRRHAQAVTAAVGVRATQPAVERAAVQPQRREDAVGRLPGRT